MDVIEAAGKPARPRLNPYTKAERRERASSPGCASAGVMRASRARKA
jgi:hypothetical protein